jgi:hypothetical protein
MRRIKLVFAAGAVMVAMLALNGGSAMADEIEGFEIDENDVEIDLAAGGDLELDDLEDGDIFGFNVLDLDDVDLDDDDNDFSINEGNERES